MTTIFFLALFAYATYWLYKLFNQSDGQPGFDIEETDPDKDAWEGGFWNALNPMPARTSLAFAYTDAHGNSTRRTVDVREYDGTLNGGLLIGHCKMRDATRTFRFDRMRDVVDIETGEVVSNVPTYLRAKYEASPEATIEKLIGEHRDMLRALLFIGKADGRLTAGERQIILNLAVAITNDKRLDDTMIKQAFNSSTIPSLAAFKQCCGRLANNQSREYCNQIIAAADQMIASEKTVHPAEQEALNYLKKRLAKPN